jgi:hypothetical protein
VLAAAYAVRSPALTARFGRPWEPRRYCRTCGGKSIGWPANRRKHPLRSGRVPLWAGWQRDLGRDDHEIYRRFFHGFGVDVIATAQTLGARGSGSAQRSPFRDVFLTMPGLWPL